MENILNINLKRKVANLNLSVVSFKDNESFIMYVPSFGMSSYGDTLDEAQDMMKFSLDEYFENLFALPEHRLMDELRGLGWEKKRFFPKKMQNLSDVTFDDIIKEFNLPDTTQIEKSRFKKELTAA